MARNMPRQEAKILTMSKISNMQDQLKELYACLLAPLSTGEAIDAKENMFLGGAVEDLYGIINALLAKDENEIAKVLVEWAGLYNELKSVLGGICYTNGDRRPSNSSFHNEAHLSRTKIKSIRCKLQSYVTILRMNGFRAVSFPDFIELARHLRELRKEENTIWSEIHALERSRNPRSNIQSQTERHSWPGADGEQLNIVSLQQDLAKGREAIGTLTRKAKELTREAEERTREAEERTRETEERTRETEELKRELADTLQEHNEYERAAKHFKDLYNAKMEEANRLRTSGDEAARGHADTIEKQSFDFGGKWVVALLNQQCSQQCYSDAEGTLLDILDRQKTLNGEQCPEMRSTHRLYCAILQKQAMRAKGNDPWRSRQKYRQLENEHRSIWDFLGAARRLDPNDRWRLEHGHELGLILAEQRRYLEAQVQHERVRTAKKKALPPGDYAIVESDLQIISMIDQQGELTPQNSQKRQELVAEVWRDKGAEASKEIVRCGYRLGKCLYDQVEYSDAETILSEALDMSKDENSALTILITYKLGQAVYFQNVPDKYEKAKNLFEKLWEARAEIPVETSLEAGWIGSYLARTYYSVDDFSKAETVIQEVWESMKDTLGPEAPKTLDAQYLLGSALFLQEKHEPAERILENLWGRRRGNEPDSAETLSAGHMLGHTRLKLRKYHLARDILQIVLTGRENLGVDTSETQTLLEEVTEKLPKVFHGRAAARSSSRGAAGEEVKVVHRTQRKCWARPSHR